MPSTTSQRPRVPLQCRRWREWLGRAGSSSSATSLSLGTSRQGGLRRRCISRGAPYPATGRSPTGICRLRDRPQHTTPSKSSGTPPTSPSLQGAPLGARASLRRPASVCCVPAAATHSRLSLRTCSARPSRAAPRTAASSCAAYAAPRTAASGATSRLQTARPTRYP